MEFWFWFQIVAAVMIGNALTAFALYFLLRLYRHEIIQKRPAETLPPWVFLCWLVPLGMAGVAIYTLV